MTFISVSLVTQSYPTLCDPMNCSSPGLLSITDSQSLLKRISIVSAMPSNHLILCHSAFSSLFQSFPASGSFPKSRFFPSGGQSIGVSASASVLDSLEDWHIETQSLQRFNKSIQVVLVVKNPPANAEETTDVGSIPGLGRSPVGEHDKSLQYSCLENPMDRGGWWTIFYRVSKNQIWLKWLSIQQPINIFHINSVVIAFPIVIMQKKY